MAEISQTPPLIQQSSPLTQSSHPYYITGTTVDINFFFPKHSEPGQTSVLPWRNWNKLFNAWWEMSHYCARIILTTPLTSMWRCGGDILRVGQAGKPEGKHRPQFSAKSQSWTPQFPPQDIPGLTEHLPMETQPPPGISALYTGSYQWFHMPHLAHGNCTWHGICQGRQVVNPVCV